MDGGDADSFTTYATNCPSCGGQRIWRTPDPVKASPTLYTLAAAAGILALMGWPLRDWREQGLFLGAVALIYFAIDGWLTVRHRTQLTNSPKRWRCEDCRLEGNHSHFFTRLPAVTLDN